VFGVVVCGFNALFYGSVSVPFTEKAAFLFGFGFSFVFWFNLSLTHFKYID